MTEDVLQFIWQTQSFNKSRLLSTDGEKIYIYDQGILNHGSGPDFSSAKIKTGELLWFGDVEIHTYASLWNDHNHSTDHNYDKVVLHVVWEEDKPVFRSDGSRMPTLELKTVLEENWYLRFQELMNSLKVVPCQSFLPRVDGLIITDTLQSALINRLESKSQEVLQLHAKYNGDWERTAITVLFAKFGFGKNKPAFEHLASIINLRVLAKLTTLLQVEAYLFGLAGLIPKDTKIDYVKLLIREYEWINKKHKVSDLEMAPTWWKFMRMRPSNFPTVRIAQLAAILSNTSGLMRDIIEKSPHQLNQQFKVEHSSFWRDHYHFRSETSSKIIGVGSGSQNGILINVVAVMLVSYGTSINDSNYIKKAVNLLEEIKPESNKIIRIWSDLGINASTAADSQALIELFNNFCKKSRCLSCPTGQFILKSNDLYN